MLTLNDGRSELWQWDTGRKLTVDADCTQVHFSNKFFGRSVDVDVFDGTAEIPDVLLQVDKDLLVWAFVGTAENGYTKISKVFKVNKRNKPADYVFTPTEQTTLEEILERIKKLEENSDVDVDLTGYAKEHWVKQNYQPKGEYLTAVPDGYAKIEDIPTRPEDIGAQPSGNYALKSEIPSVPVQSVNGKTGAVKLGAADVGARPSNWMPTAQEVGALPSNYTPPNQTAEQVGADPKGTAASAVSQHNTDDDSHNDIRLELKAINDRLTAFFDSDNQTLDELSEIVSYITSNRALIDSITTSKVSVVDIINNLTTNVANKPLSAAQGVVLKDLIDAVSSSLSNYQPKGDYALRSELPTVPTKVSQLENDKGYLTEHQDISGKLDADKLPEAVNAALAQAKASGEFDGDPGAPGVTPHIGTNGNWYIGSADTGVKAQGKDGTNGTSVTVKSVSESTADGGSNVVTFSDGNTLNVKNGRKGNKGDPGTTPQKGIDFWTPADQEAIVQQVITALGTPVFGRVDSDKNIILSTTGVLADGTYKLWIEGEDGKLAELCAYNHSNVPEPTYTNLLPLAINSDGTPYNGGQGWKTGYRLNSSGAETAQAGIEISGFMPVTDSDTVYFSNIEWSHTHAEAQYCYVAFYNSAFELVTSKRFSAMATNDDGRVFDSNNNVIAINVPKFLDYYGFTSAVAYMRISAITITGDSIITKNEPIE